MNTHDDLDGWAACSDGWAELNAKHNEEWATLHAQTNSDWAALSDKHNNQWFAVSMAGYGWGLLLGLTFGYWLGVTL